MPRVCIVESESHPAPGTLGRRLPEFGDFIVRTTTTVPEHLDTREALVMNNIYVGEPGQTREERILSFVAEGGGLFGVHDSVFPHGPNERFAAAFGIRKAQGGVVSIEMQEGMEHRVMLAKSDERDPMQRFPIRTVPPGHPILRGVVDFDLAEEVWAQNVAAEVQPLLTVHVGDIISAHQRFRDPIPIAGCGALGRGRLAFFSLGHFAATYQHPSFLRFAANALLWVTRSMNEEQFLHDLFLSFSTQNAREAARIHHRGTELGLNVFLTERNLNTGDVWDEKIRKALVGSREVAILMTPDSLKSEWVATEWGAAWAMQKRITPIVLRCDFDQLPKRLARHQAIDFHDFERYLMELRDRGRE
jgi:hypothetical protein